MSIRNAMKFVSYQDRKKVAAGMPAIDTAPSREAAEVEFTNVGADYYSPGFAVCVALVALCSWCIGRP
jgi:transposase-like protein